MGGIWIFWDKNKIQLESILIGDQIMNVMVKEPNKGPWIMSVVYASPHLALGTALWEYVQ